MAHNAGVNDNAVNKESAMAATIVTENCRYISPVEPPSNAIGTNTAERTSTIPTSAPSSAITRSTFSTTTIASSTSRPMARTRPNIVRVLMVKPATERTANVPSMTTGTAIVGISVARKFCKNKYITMKTKTMASTSVLTTSCMDILMKGVVS